MSTTSLYYATTVHTDSACALNYGYPTTFFDLTMVFSGNLYYNINGQNIILRKNDVILIPPGSMRIRQQGNEPVHYMSLNYHSDGVTEKDIPLYIPGCRTFFKESMFYFNKLLSNTHSYTRKVISHGIDLLIELLKNEVESQKLNPHVHHILDYISKHITQHMTLNEIADGVFLTVPYCCNLVKKELNTTIYDIILNERIALAKQYLVSNTFPLKDIPYHCGFNDYSHFYKCFKKRTGISPSKYKA